MIPYGHQEIIQSDIDAVVKVLRSDFLTQGNEVPKFESSIVEYTGVNYGIAVNSGTSALHIACLALGLQSGDILWTSATTFVASANCGRYCGAVVDFVDIDPETCNIDVEKLHEKLITARKKNRLPKVVIPVHFAGQPTDQKRIWELSEEFGFSIIEDASHSLGASRNGEKVGSCRWSDITVFSFHPVKLITTGEGGMAVTNDEELAHRMKMLRVHGITRDPDYMNKESEGPWYYEQIELGMNYRMTDIQAALGNNQLGRLDSFIEKRNTYAKYYNDSLSDLALKLPKIKDENFSTFHLYVVRLNNDERIKQYKYIFETLLKKGVGVNLHYLPVHLQPYYRNFGFKVGQFPEAEKFAKQALTIPLFPSMSKKQLEQVVTTLSEILEVE